MAPSPEVWRWGVLPGKRGERKAFPAEPLFRGVGEPNPEGLCDFSVEKKLNV